MPDSGSLDAGIEIVAHFILIVAMKFSTQKGCDVIGFDGMDSRANELILDRFQIPLTFEDNIRRV